MGAQNFNRSSVVNLHQIMEFSHNRSPQNQLFLRDWRAVNCYKETGSSNVRHRIARPRIGIAFNIVKNVKKGLPKPDEKHVEGERAEGLGAVFSKDM